MEAESGTFEDSLLNQGRMEGWTEQIEKEKEQKKRCGGKGNGGGHSDK